MHAEYAFQKGELLEASVISSLANTLNVIVLVEYKSGKRDRFTWRFTTVATRTTELFATNRVFHEDGRVLNATVRPDTDSKRGQTYLGLYITPTAESALNYGNLCQGYVYSQHNLSIGEFIESGPGGGEGFLFWNNLVTDAAGNAAVQSTTGLANTIRRIHGFVLLYNAIGVATRTVTVRLRKPGSAPLPTGFATAANAVVWNSPTLTLTDAEEGTQYIGEGKGFQSINDNGTLTLSDNTTVPHPFPYTFIETDTGALESNIGGGLAADTWTWFLLTEEWLVV